MDTSGMNERQLDDDRCSGTITWVRTKFLKSKGINRKNKIQIQRSNIGFFNYLKYLANESKAEKWVKRRVTRLLVF